MVRDLLAGAPADPGLLDYELAGVHIGVIAWGRGPEGAVDALAAAVGRRALAVSVVPGTVWAWLSGRVPLDSRAKRKLDLHLPPDGAALAIGDPGSWRRRLPGDSPPGAPGSRRGPGAASPRKPLGRRRSRGLRHPGLAGRAQDFAERELGTLIETTGSRSDSRATLREYFKASQNAAAAAARLDVHERTVANRLHAVEERLGRPVNARRAEIETALRLLDVLETPPDS